jgi:uncharacterized membrane protein
MDIIVVLIWRHAYCQVITDVSSSIAASIFEVAQVTQKITSIHGIFT